MSLLRYTGHPFVDVGVATVTAMSNKSLPEEVDYDDLEAVAKRLKEDYSTVKLLQNHISSYFLNSWFVQPSKSEEDKRAYADEVLFGFRPDRQTLDGVQCTFFPKKPAIIFAHRQHVPLLNGDGIRNFSGVNMAGIPVSGVALLAIHALPLGCVKCGYFLGFHQMRPLNGQVRDMTLELARINLRRNETGIQMIKQGSGDGLSNLGGFKRTRYVEALLAAQLQIRRRRMSDMHNITGYYFTNYGPKPLLEIIRLDNHIADFINVVQNDAPDAWQRAVWAGWSLQKGESAAALQAEETGTRRNAVYEMLFDLPYQAVGFLKLLRVGRDWRLIELFLRKVMAMEQERIDTYRTLGDRLAEYMVKYESDEEGDYAMGFYYAISRAKNYAALRTALRKASERVLKAGEPDPLFSYADFIAAFEHPSQPYSQWRLGRDLIAFRMLEMLKEQGVDVSNAMYEIEGEEGEEGEE